MKEFKFKVIETREREIIINAESLDEAENKYLDSGDEDSFLELSSIWTGAKIINKEEC